MRSGADRVTADPGGALKFTTTKLTAKAGTVTIMMNNPASSGNERGIAVSGNGVDRDGQIVQPGATSTVKLTLKRGTYTFYCPVPGHDEAFALPEPLAPSAEPDWSTASGPGHRGERA